MKEKRLSLPEIVVVIAAVHIFLCYSYLVFRNYGFGSDVAQFLSIGDIFTVGVSRLLPTYLMLSLGFLLGHLVSDEKPLKLKGRVDFDLHPSLRTGIGNWPIKALPYLMVIALVVGLLTSRTVQSIPLAFLLTMACARLVLSLLKENEIDKRYAIPSIFAVFVYIYLAVSAYAFGFIARTADPSQLETPVQCDSKAKFLFASGENYVVVLNSGIRALIKDDCSIIAAFPQKRAVVDIR